MRIQHPGLDCLSDRVPTAFIIPVHPSPVLTFYFDSRGTGMRLSLINYGTANRNSALVYAQLPHVISKYIGLSVSNVALQLIELSECSLMLNLSIGFCVDLETYFRNTALFQYFSFIFSVAVCLKFSFST